MRQGIRFLADPGVRRRCARWTLAASFATVALGWGLAPAETHAFNAMRGVTRQFTRPVMHSLRTVIRPTLGIVRERAGSVAEVHAGRLRDQLFVILEDGSARLWDLERGVQVGGALASGLVSGTLHEDGEPESWKAIAVRRDGAVLTVGPDGSVRRTSHRVADLDSAIAPVVSGDGSVLVFRARNGGWHWMRVGDGRGGPLPEARRDVRPIVSGDGRSVAYRTLRGAWFVGSLSGDGRAAGTGRREGMQVGGCASHRDRVTAGAFTPDGSRLVLGDERGRLCTFRLSASGALERGPVQGAAYPGAIRRIAIGGEGVHVALGGDGNAVAIRRIAGESRRRPVIELESSPTGALALDARRGRLFAGEHGGTTGWYSLASGTRVARLVSTATGWSVVDREGRFDGTENGIDALVWAGEEESQTLPVDAFSQSYFEPGLLAKLAGRSRAFLNKDIRDLGTDGYHPPPSVTIEPMELRDVDARRRLTVRVRVQRDYPWDVLGVRLFHNGKRVLPERSPRARKGEAIEFMVRLSPGENVFTAIGVGPGGVEGRPATAKLRSAEREPDKPTLQVIAVGINDYGPPEWRLDFSRNDAEAIAQTLDRRAGGVFGEVSAVTLLEASASLDAIEQHVLRRPSSPEDVLVVYLAGHGYALPEGDGWEWYFLPFSSAWSDATVGVEERVRRHGLSSRRLMGFLVRTQPRRVFLILDSCRSGAVVEAMSGSGDAAILTDSAGRKALRHMARVGGIHVLAAARANEDATELVSQPHGALTYLVLEGVRGAADTNLDRTISVREIVEYATREMPLLSRRLARDTITQQPVGYSRGADFSVAGG